MNHQTLHFYSTKQQPLLEIMCFQLGLSRQQAHFLIEIGAVYQNKIRCRDNVSLPQRTYLRVHLNPKRYFCDEIGLLKTANGIVFVDKPFGLPSHPTLDNFKENAKYLVEQKLGRPIFPLTRLDVGTSGILPFALTRDAQKWFLNIQWEKRYFALTQTPVSPGQYTHAMKQNLKPPHCFFLREAKTAGLKDCQLTVLSNTQHEFGFVSDIDLTTGRTHQIRGQFNALGSPIVNDSMYGSKQSHSVPSKRLSEAHGLVCYSLRPSTDHKPDNECSCHINDSISRLKFVSKLDGC